LCCRATPGQRSGEPFVVEWLNRQLTLEAQALRYQEELRKIGVDFQIRTVDTSQYIARVRTRDYDVIYTSFGQSNSPGNELLFLFGTEAAGLEGTPNYAGIANPAVDAIIELIIGAPDRAELEAATRALDRVLTWNYYLTPGYTLRAARIAYWNRFSHPENLHHSASLPEHLVVRRGEGRAGWPAPIRTMAIGAADLARVKCKVGRFVRPDLRMRHRGRRWTPARHRPRETDPASMMTKASQ
jgi:hypothetical protein